MQIENIVSDPFDSSKYYPELGEFICLEAFNPPVLTSLGDTLLLLLFYSAFFSLFGFGNSARCTCTKYIYFFFYRILYVVA